MSITPSLRNLEAEAIDILRETAAAFARPLILYSVGKDSSVLVHLAVKAFAPGPVPMPLLHIDTTWKFREMIAFRDATARRLGLTLHVYTNEAGLKAGMNPFDYGSATYTDVMKTQALRQALAKYQTDAAVGGARRDEERSRAKERVFSVRGTGQTWNPRAQRPELWTTYNTRLGPDDSMRVFPLSNWTELEVWEYIRAEHIEVVPLYFARPRPVVVRRGALIMVDDERMRLNPGERPQLRTVRFRTLGCYPLSGAVESTAADIDAVIAELKASRESERQGRLIDTDQAGSMERKKREGYF